MKIEVLVSDCCFGRIPCPFLCYLSGERRKSWESPRAMLSDRRLNQPSLWHIPCFCVPICFCIRTNTFCENRRTDVNCSMNLARPLTLYGSHQETENRQAKNLALPLTQSRSDLIGKTYYYIVNRTSSSFGQLRLCCQGWHTAFKDEMIYGKSRHDSKQLNAQRERFEQRCRTSSQL
jgi:hypothetical protein